MEQHHKMTPGFFFTSLGVLITLVVSASSFLMLVFGLLDKKFPDVVNAVYQYGYSAADYSGTRSALATLIIVFPVFFVLSRVWKKLSAGTLGLIDAAIRRWVLYLVLFLSSSMVTIDLVTLVRYFISGETTCRFMLKVLATFVTAIIIGTFYGAELYGKRKALAQRVATIASVATVLTAIVCSFILTGSPKTQRAYRLDDRRVQDLQSIQWQVINYWQRKEELPATLSDLTDPLSSYAVPNDPEFQQGLAYEYLVTGKQSFQLCATFAQPIPEGLREYSSGGMMPFPARDISMTSKPYPSGTNESWIHGSGKTCFDRTIDPELYPPFEQGAKQ